MASKTAGAGTMVEASGSNYRFQFNHRGISTELFMLICCEDQPVDSEEDHLSEPQSSMSGSIPDKISRQPVFEPIRRMRTMMDYSIPCQQPKRFTRTMWRELVRRAITKFLE